MTDSKKQNKNFSLMLDYLIEKSFLIISITSLLILFAIMFFLIKEGVPLFKEINVSDFIFGKEWYPVSDNLRLGIFPLIIASIYITILASLIAIPISLAVAIYIAEIASGKFKELIKALIEIIASIPSVVIGFFGMVVLAPFLIKNFDINSGLNLLNASLLLAFTVIPIITSISEDAISSIPVSLKEASYALGANRWQTIVHIVMPASLSGIWTAIILGISRIIGETMIVLMVAGGAAIIPKSVFDPVRPLTSNVAAEMAEAAVGGIHYKALFAIGIILFIITFIFNITADYLSNKYKFKNS